MLESKLFTVLSVVTFIALTTAVVFQVLEAQTLSLF